LRHRPDLWNARRFRPVAGGRSRQGLKLILDVVPNHTADQHPWFIESRSSICSARRDRRIWRDPNPRWRSAKQLAQRIRWTGLDLGQAKRTIFQSPA
jgi:glycosidase